MPNDEEESVPCPECGTVVRVRERPAEKRCYECGERFRVEEEEEDDPPEEVEIRVESPNSSSDIVVRGTPHAIEITLDPMETPIRRLDVYPEDAEAFVEAVQKAGAVVDPDYWENHD